MRDERIKAYARLTARTGANVQPGQGAVIYTQPEACGFARMVAEELYQAHEKLYRILSTRDVDGVYR